MDNNIIGLVNKYNIYTSKLFFAYRILNDLYDGKILRKNSTIKDESVDESKVNEKIMTYTNAIYAIKDKRDKIERQLFSYGVVLIFTKGKDDTLMTKKFEEYTNKLFQLYRELFFKGDSITESKFDLILNERNELEEKMAISGESLSSSFDQSKPLVYLKQKKINLKPNE